MRERKTSYKLVIFITVGLLFRSTIAVSAQNQNDFVTWNDYMVFDRFQNKRDFLMQTDRIWSNSLFSPSQRKEYIHILSEFLYQRVFDSNPDRVFSHWLVANEVENSLLIQLFAAQLSAANLEFQTALSFCKKPDLANLPSLKNEFPEIVNNIEQRSEDQQKVKDFALFDYNFPFRDITDLEGIVFSSTHDSLFFNDTNNYYQLTGLNCNKRTIDTLTFQAGSPTNCQLSSVFNNTYYFSCPNEIRGDLDIYKAKLEEKYFTDFQCLPSPINTVSDETGFYRLKNGEQAFFSSKRPGGLGGFDIYLATEKELQTGGAAKHVLNLNTKTDDVIACLGDNDDLFLSTPGRNPQRINEFCIGQGNPDSGYDIASLGYPINSILNNNDVLAYSNGVLLKTFGNEDRKKIIGVFLNSTIPFTLVRGTLVEQKNGNRAFLKSDVKIIDKETKKVSDLVFLPESKPGFFYAILQPGKKYDMFISADGYKSHIVSIELPYQPYFYTIFQQIDLFPLQVGSKQVGQQIKVQNTFFDIYKVAADGIERPYDLKAYSSLTKIKDLTAFLIGENDSLSYIRLSSNNSFNEHQDALVRGKNYSELLTRIDSAFHFSDTCLIRKLTQNAFATHKFVESYFYNDSIGRSAIVDLVFDKIEYTAFGPLDTKITNQLSEPYLWNEYQKATKLLEGSLLDLEGVEDTVLFNKHLNLFRIPFESLINGKICLTTQIEFEQYLTELSNQIRNLKIVVILPDIIPEAQDLGRFDIKNGFDFLLKMGILQENIKFRRASGSSVVADSVDNNCSISTKEPIKVLILETTEY